MAPLLQYSDLENSMAVEPGWSQSMELQRVGHELEKLADTFYIENILYNRQPGIIKMIDQEHL